MNRHRNPILSIVCPLLVLIAGVAQAQTVYDWTSTTDGSWGTAANWDPNTGVPGDNVGDSAEFNTASTGSTITLDGNRVLNAVSFGAALPEWTINPGSDPLSALTLGTTPAKFTVTDTIVNFNARLNAGIATAEFVASGDGGTVNFTGILGSRTSLGSFATAGTTGMIYNLNATNIVGERLFAGFNAGISQVPVNSTVGTTVNVNQSQTTTNEITVGGGNNATNAGVVLIRNGATWTQNGGAFQLGFSNTSGQFGASHGRVEVGVVGDSTGNVTIGNSGGLTIGTRSGTGILNINNGTVTVNANSDSALITLAASGSTTTYGGTGTLNLNAGGTLVTARNFITTGSGAGTFNFNGGLLQINRATGNVTTDLFSGTGITVNVQNGGARIDTQANSTVINQGLIGAGTGGLEKLGAGTLTLNGANTFTGNTTVSAGTLTLSNTSEMLFVIGATGVNNSIGGTGILNLDGVFKFDLSGAAAIGSWNIVNVASLAENYGMNFEVDGFTNNSGTWTSGDYTFVQSTGVLTAIPEPSAFALLAIFGAFVMARRRSRQAAVN